MLFEKTLFYHNASLNPGKQIGTEKFSGNSHEIPKGLLLSTILLVSSGSGHWNKLRDNRCPCLRVRMYHWLLHPTKLLVVQNLKPTSYSSAFPTGWRKTSVLPGRHVAQCIPDLCLVLIPRILERLSKRKFVSMKATIVALKRCLSRSKDVHKISSFISYLQRRLGVIATVAVRVRNLQSLW